MTKLDKLINALTRLFTKPQPTITMNPAILSLIIAALQAAIEDTPEIVADLKLVFDNPDPTPADWEALRAKVLAKSYADHVPASALPTSSGAPLLPPVQPVPSSTAAPAAPAAPAPAAAVEIPSHLPNGELNPAYVIPPTLADGSPNPAFKST